MVNYTVNYIVNKK